MIVFEGDETSRPFPSGLGVARPRSEPRLLSVRASGRSAAGPSRLLRRAGRRSPALWPLSPDIAVEDVIDALDSFYCHNVVAALWADAGANRLEGPAIYLLSDEIPEVAEHARAAAARLADR